MRINAPPHGSQKPLRGSEEPELEKSGAGKKEEEEARPRPATYARQLQKSLIHRLMEAGHPTVTLTQNF